MTTADLLYRLLHDRIEQGLEVKKMTISELARAINRSESSVRRACRTGLRNASRMLEMIPLTDADLDAIEDQMRRRPRR